MPLIYKCFVSGGMGIEFQVWSLLVNALSLSCIYPKLLFNPLKGLLGLCGQAAQADLFVSLGQGLGFYFLRWPRCWHYRSVPPGPLYVSSVGSVLLVTSISENRSTKSFRHCRMLSGSGSRHKVFHRRALGCRQGRWSVD